MTLVITLFFPSVCTSGESLERTEVLQNPAFELQEECLFRVLGVNGLSSFRRHLHLAPLYLYDDMHERNLVCEWKSVTCEDGIITGIRWVTDNSWPIELINLYIRWIPATVRELEIRSQETATKEPLDTRFFPRAAEFIAIDYCQLEGTVDLTDLPLQLRTLSLNGNPLYGLIDLRSLSANLTRVSLISTEIDMVIVDNFLLKKELRSVDVVSVQEIDVLEVNNEKLDHRVSASRYVDSF